MLTFRGEMKSVPPKHVLCVEMWVMIQEPKAHLVTPAPKLPVDLADEGLGAAACGTGLSWAPNIVTQLAPKTKQKNIANPLHPLPKIFLPIILWKLTIPESLHSIPNYFGVNKSTARAMVQEVCLVIQNVLVTCIILLSNSHMIIIIISSF